LLDLDYISFDPRFRWVICQLAALRRRIPGTIARALKELPQTLDETYDRILSGIDKDSQEYALCLFQCLCVSIRPLRLAELAEVLAILFDTGRDSEDNVDWRSDDAQRALLSACSSLITVVDVDGFPVIQFAHFTVREYLMSDRLANAGERLSRYHILPHSAHTTLARASLGVLLSLDGHVDKIAMQEYPLAIYGAQYWVDHAKFGTVSSDIQDLMERLFDRNRPYFAAWVWIYDFDHPFGGQMSMMCPKQPQASPLYYAALCGFPGVVKHLAITHPGDVSARGGVGMTPLNAALKKEDINVVQALLDCGANINVLDAEGFSPLHRASLSGNSDAVQLLINCRADLNIALASDGKSDACLTPLYVAAQQGELAICQLLVEHGADINPRDECGMSPLQTASVRKNSLKHLDVVTFLLDNGAPIDYRSEGLTALILASHFGCAEVVRILIQRGADVACRDDGQSTPLHKASKQGHPDIVQDLLENSADPNAQDELLETPLHRALRNGNLEVAHCLLKHGANIMSFYFYFNQFLFRDVSLKQGPVVA
jgi:ankyrin repeat protein